MCEVELVLIFLEVTLRRGHFLKRLGRDFQDGVPQGLLLLTLFGDYMRLRNYGDTNN